MTPGRRRRPAGAGLDGLGVNNVTLAFGTPGQVRQEVKTLIETLGREGGYIMDASAIMQNDTTPENMRALVEATHEFGCYEPWCRRSCGRPDTPIRGHAPAGWAAARIAPTIGRLDSSTRGGRRR